MQNQKYQTCIDACNVCFKACQSCSIYYVFEQDAKIKAKCIQLVNECTTASQFTSSDSDYLKPILKEPIILSAMGRSESNLLGFEPQEI